LAAAVAERAQGHVLVSTVGGEVLYFITILIKTRVKNHILSKGGLTSLLTITSLVAPLSSALVTSLIPKIKNGNSFD
jgi:hypothetical protein